MEVHKMCGVCGDKALGYNFNALTCESCKAFFRRNALRNKVFRCITAGNCQLNQKTRKYCRKCRLDKCFQIGMKKDWILTEEEKLLKRRKHRNRDTEKKDADSSSTSVNYGNNWDSKVAPGKIDDTNKSNIIILPILPMSLEGEKCPDSNQMLSSLNKSKIINYINNKFNLTLDRSSSSFQIDNGDKCEISAPELGNNNIIVCPTNVYGELSNLTKTVSTTDSNEAMFSDYNINSDNSSCSFTGLFNGDNLSTTTPATYPQNGDQKSVIVGPQGHQSLATNIPSTTTTTTNIHNSDNPEPSQNNFKANTYLNNSFNGQLNRADSEESFTGTNNNKPDYSSDMISDNVYKHAIQLEYTTNPLKNDYCGLDRDRNCRKLNKLEQNRLDEVNQYFKPLYITGTNENPKKIISDIADGLQYFESAIKRIIIAIKNIQSFKSMCQDDQISLLKGSAGEIKGLFNIRYFNAAQELCMVPNPREPNSILIIDHDYLKKTYGEELYLRVKRFILSFRTDWKNDDSIINLMAMILLFYPNRSNLLHREYIKLEYLTYSHLLQRYLEVKYNSVCEAKTIYLNLMNRLEQMHELNEQCMELILKMDHKYIGPLTFELYDIKNRLKLT